jgi:hypothetical protein
MEIERSLQFKSKEIINAIICTTEQGYKPAVEPNDFQDEGTSFNQNVWIQRFT